MINGKESTTQERTDNKERTDGKKSVGKGERENCIIQQQEGSTTKS